ncbi:MAG: hydrogenase small subunit [Bacteroidetes bacterium]|nr:hydrogenase small subunit [Bacteroidota bacterium]
MNTKTFDGDIDAVFESVGVSRRDFLKFCGAMTALLGLPPIFAGRIARALESRMPVTGERRPSVLWLNLQSCTGCTESFTRADHPSIAEAVLGMISLDFNETLQAASGTEAEAACESAMNENYGKYILVVEGSVPAAENGIYCVMCGRTGESFLKKMSAGAGCVIALGTCSVYGGLPAALPNPTAARGIDDIVGSKTLVNIPGCPPIGDVLMATIVHYLFFGSALSADVMSTQSSAWR